jgi:hypothetical protein
MCSDESSPRWIIPHAAANNGWPPGDGSYRTSRRMPTLSTSPIPRNVAITAEPP